jgi:hypothetical protein
MLIRPGGGDRAGWSAIPLAGRGRPLPRARLQDDGILLRPLIRRSSFVPWTKVKGVRVAPADRWSGPAAVPGEHGYYMVQVRLAGEWRRVGDICRVRHSVVPYAVREKLFGERRSRPYAEVVLLRGYELVSTLWQRAGGTPGEEDDNWPRLDRPERPPDRPTTG